MAKTSRRQFSPEEKAAAVAELIDGRPWAEVCEKYGCSVGILHRWKNEAGASLAVRPENVQARFDEKIKGLLLSSLDLLQTWAEMAGDKDFIRANASGAHELGTTVLDRCDRIAALLREPSANGGADQAE